MLEAAVISQDKHRLQHLADKGRPTGRHHANPARPHRQAALRPSPLQQPCQCHSRHRRHRRHRAPARQPRNDGPHLGEPVRHTRRPRLQRNLPESHRRPSRLRRLPLLRPPIALGSSPSSRRPSAWPTFSPTACSSYAVSRRGPSTSKPSSAKAKSRSIIRSVSRSRSAQKPTTLLHAGKDPTIPRNPWSKKS